MQFQLALLGLTATAVQVLAVPAEVPRDSAEVTQFDSFPGDKTMAAAVAADADAVLADACWWCGSPCGGYYCCDPLPYCGYYTNPFVCVCTN